jgi:hypothetical protein
MVPAWVTCVPSHAQPDEVLTQFFPPQVIAWALVASESSIAARSATFIVL